MAAEKKPKTYAKMTFKGTEIVSLEAGMKHTREVIGKRLEAASSPAEKDFYNRLISKYGELNDRLTKAIQSSSDKKITLALNEEEFSSLRGSAALLREYLFGLYREKNDPNTWDEHGSVIENLDALEDRFQKILVADTSQDADPADYPEEE